MDRHGGHLSHELVLPRPHGQRYVVDACQRIAARRNGHGRRRCGRPVDGIGHVGGDDDGDDAADCGSFSVGVLAPVGAPRPGSHQWRDCVVRRWIRSVLDSVRSARRARAMGAHPCPAPRFDGAQHEHDVERGYPVSCWRLPVAAAKECMPVQVSIATRLLLGPLARRQVRRLLARPKARRLLRRLLLGIDGRDVRRRRDEPCLDGPHHACGPQRESHSGQLAI